MPAGQYPQSAGIDQGNAVELKRCDRGSSGWSQADHEQATLLPREVFVPTLRIGVKQSDYRTAIWIDTGNPGAFETIAFPTGQTEVFGSCATAQRFGYDMVNREHATGDRFSSLAVAATMACALRDTCSQHRGIWSRTSNRLRRTEALDVVTALFEQDRRFRSHQHCPIGEMRQAFQLSFLYRGQPNALALQDQSLHAFAILPWECRARSLHISVSVR